MRRSEDLVLAYRLEALESSHAVVGQAYIAADIFMQRSIGSIRWPPPARRKAPVTSAEYRYNRSANGARYMNWA